MSQTKLFVIAVAAFVASGCWNNFDDPSVVGTIRVLSAEETYQRAAVTIPGCGILEGDGYFCDHNGQKIRAEFMLGAPNNNVPMRMYDVLGKGDVDADGVDDVVGCARDGIFVMKGLGSDPCAFSPAVSLGEFGSSMNDGAKYVSIQVVDMNHDKLPDILLGISGSATQTSLKLLQQSGGAFVSEYVVPTKGPNTSYGNSAYIGYFSLYTEESIFSGNDSNSSFVTPDPSGISDAFYSVCPMGYAWINVKGERCLFVSGTSHSNLLLVLRGGRWQNIANDVGLQANDFFAYWPVATDINGDGLTDLVAPRLSGNQGNQGIFSEPLLVYLQRPDGTFAYVSSRMNLEGLGVLPPATLLACDGTTCVLGGYNSRVVLKLEVE